MLKFSSGRLFILVSGLVAFIDLMFVSMNHYFADQSFRQTMKQESHGLYLNFETLLSQTYTNMLTIATFVAGDPEVQQLFLKGKDAVIREGGGSGGHEAAHYRQALYERVSNSWHDVQGTYNARQLHFHLGPGATSFLRVHKPTKFGDSLDDVRFTVVDTNIEKTPRTGFETGRVYSGLRGVIPVSANDPETGERVHVGVLEVGTSFDVILKILASTSHYQAGVLLSHQHLQSAMWPETFASRFGQQKTKCDCLIEAASSEQLSDVIDASYDKGIYFRNSGNDVIKVNGQHLLVSYFPLRDYLGTRDASREDAGAVVFWKNIDTELSQFKANQWYNILYGIFGFLVIEMLFIAAFRYGNQQLKVTLKAHAEALTTHKERLDAAQEIARVGSWEWNLQNNDLWWSDEVYRIFELDPTEEQPTYDMFLSHVHPADRDTLEQAVQRAMLSQQEYRIEHRIILPSGKILQVLECGSVTTDNENKPCLMKGTIQDITAIKRTEQRLAEIIWAADVGTWELDICSGNLVCNDRWAQMLGYSLKQLSPMTLSRWKSLISPSSLPEFQRRIHAKMAGETALFEDEFMARHRDGHWVWILARGRIVERDVNGTPIRLAGTCLDISKRKNSELQARVLATTDPLTGLFNRAVFNEKITDMVNLAQRTHQPFSLMMLDLDGFKAVNDHYGHPAGDQLLSQVADELKDLCRETDILARLGGDEFAIILPSTSTRQGCQVLAQRLLEQISSTRIIEGHTIGVNASIGYCIYHWPDMTVKEMVQAADTAMYQSKARGKNTYTGWIEGPVEP